MANATSLVLCCLSTIKVLPRQPRSPELAYARKKFLRCQRAAAAAAPVPLRALPWYQSLNRQPGPVASLVVRESKCPGSGARNINLQCAPIVTARVRCLRDGRVCAYPIYSIIALQVVDLDFMPFWAGWHSGKSYHSATVTLTRKSCRKIMSLGRSFKSVQNLHFSV